MMGVLRSVIKGESSIGVGGELKSSKVVYGVSNGEVRYSPKLCAGLNSGEAWTMSINGWRSDSFDGAEDIGSTTASKRREEDEEGSVGAEESDAGVDNMFK
jgi:hypothetical protein